MPLAKPIITNAQTSQASADRQPRHGGGSIRFQTLLPFTFILPISGDISWPGIAAGNHLLIVSKRCSVWVQPIPQGSALERSQIKAFVNARREARVFLGVVHHRQIVSRSRDFIKPRYLSAWASQFTGRIHKSAEGAYGRPGERRAAATGPSPA